MEQLANEITRYLLQQNIIKQEEKNIYLFGFKLFLKYVVVVFCVILLSIANSSLKEASVTIILCVTLRSYAGGVHLKKDHFCLIFSVIIIQSIILINKFISFDLVYNIFFSVVSLMLIAVIGPIDNKNKPLSKLEKNFLRQRLWKIEVIQLFFFFLSILGKQTDLITLFTLNFCINLVSILLGRVVREKSSMLFL